MAEYLDGIKALYNTDKYTAIEIITDKNTYTAKLPYTIERKTYKGDVYYYTISVKDWCKLRRIIVKDYFWIQSTKVD